MWRVVTMPLPPERDDDSLAAILELRQRIQRLRRHVLEPGVLRAQVSYRLPMVRRLAARPEVCARHECFSKACRAYACAVETAGAPLPSSCKTMLDTLQWWVPLTKPDDPVVVERAIRHQDFPYRAIAQTRDVSIGGVMLDIGANVGRMSVSRVVLGDAVLAYCAEPDPLNFACLVRNTLDNGLRGLVLPDRVAIGATEGTVRLLRGKSAGGHRVLAEEEPASGETVEVPCLPLDVWVERIGADLDQVRFVKVDVQGYEVDVLRGAARVLSCRHIAWQMEVDLGMLSARGVHAGTDLYPLMQQSFTHFIDLNRHQLGDRIRPVGCLPEALAYVTAGSKGRTDVVLFNLDPAFSAEFD